ncbi:MAG: cisplatin damage response ATP-dependent DNA ligase [Rhizobiales bacterium]|nr:cisplatin damage response ATP-dependent DNA ligase [Hyphomicrobiales bacterium]
MERFAELLDRLVYTTARNAKLKLLTDYFRTTPDPDRGWALSALTDGLPLRLPIRRTLQTILEPYVDPELYRLSRDYVGDTAETVSLLWPDHRDADPPRVKEVVETIKASSLREFPQVLAGFLDRLDAKGRFALLKFLSGALRVGVSARLAKTGLAAAFGRDVGEIEEVWHGIEPPYTELFEWLEGRAERPDPGSKASFRPVMLAHPIEEEDWRGLAPQDVVAEWKWDGIRVQLAAKHGKVRLFSRAGDEISASFPEIGQAFAHTDGVLDGELLILRDGEVAPFNDLQQRLNRKTVTPKMLRDYPAHIRLYDLLFDEGEDIRRLSFVERRRRLELWYERFVPSLADVSALVAFEDFAALDVLWRGARAEGIEGLMLKRKESPYLAGRPKGHWFKWKRAALTLDCVLMYAQRGSGKRSSYYSDYTFGVWDGDKLVPVGKAYSGFTDEELLRLDRWIRNNTVERFGPVRAVTPGLVLEVAFDAVHPSGRHKSGVAMRFPRIHRIRWDKPATEADTLETVKKLLAG